MKTKILNFITQKTLIDDVLVFLKKIDAKWFQKVKKIKLIVKGHGEYPADILISLVKDDIVIPLFSPSEDCSFTFFVEKEFDCLNGEKVKGTWKIIVEDIYEEDENYIDRLTLIIYL